MGLQTFKGDYNNLNDDMINDSYALYLQKYVEIDSCKGVNDTQEECTLMSLEEFKEYYILNVLGRASEFTENIARDYQYLTFDNWTQLSVFS